VLYDFKLSPDFPRQKSHKNQGQFPFSKLIQRKKGNERKKRSDNSSKLLSYHHFLNGIFKWSALELFLLIMLKIPRKEKSQFVFHVQLFQILDQKKIN
jgi:hypothetical protein